MPDSMDSVHSFEVVDSSNKLAPASEMLIGSLSGAIPAVRGNPLHESPRIFACVSGGTVPLEDVEGALCSDVAGSVAGLTGSREVVGAPGFRFRLP
jgi:hypothetical protein